MFRKAIREHPAKVVRKCREPAYQGHGGLPFSHDRTGAPGADEKCAVTRYWQKQQLNRQYRKQAREAAKQTAKAAAGKTASATERLTVRAVAFVKEHPAGAVVAGGCVLLLLVLQSCSCPRLCWGNGVAGAIGASTYPGEDADMLGAEAAYCALEDELQHYLDTYHPHPRL